MDERATAEAPLSRWELAQRTVGYLMAVVGTFIAALGGVLLYMWETTDSPHGEIAFLFLFGALFAFFGGSLIIGGLFDALRLPGHRMVRWLPVGAAVLIYLFFQSFR